MSHKIHITRHYSLFHPKNEGRCYKLTPGMNVHCIHEVSTTLVAVSMDFHLELFDVLSGTLNRKIKTDTMFQFLVRVNPLQAVFEMNDRFVQESCIGYNYGSITSVGIADIRQIPKDHDSEMSDMSQVVEESKDGLSFLETMNFAVF